MSKEESQIIRITPKGLLYHILEDPDLTEKVMDKLELYCRKHICKSGIPAIVMTGGGWEFTEVELNEESEKPLDKTQP